MRSIEFFINFSYEDIQEQKCAWIKSLVDCQTTMLYELIAIARVSNPAHIHNEAKALASTIGKLVINNKGVVREVVSLGCRPLPKLMKKAGERHFQGSHFLMLFDSSSAVQREIIRSLKNDPRVIRVNLLRVDDKVDLSPGSSYTRAVRNLALSSQ